MNTFTDDRKSIKLFRLIYYFLCWIVMARLKALEETTPWNAQFERKIEGDKVFL